ncbi:MAG TPA: EamA family transporter [Marinilabiliales bacterium]|nr:MAG: hypothetical protein A2W84_17075 [Bacteroidetes bacterium GWC2_40_13]OFX75187.1 MAG: hypothetical protein A2W96_16440 [Bacteroidetes bacterium GWD2_40_43]OFX89784.1 MAG: hypothetical protein A2W97_12100 [Bacteroidetes bacterium GWE2_40_63]OFY22031.1 MAG: hypothetical protein A2W88_00745 [Bacteroidetes bacterium GWF2_40_13]OFZ26118.1 MAG: hypothetical protein A2437_10425 [Bacteroidetes bacterium RIFOXYC2_FULL_40_12]HAM97076.1 EamA family transporter [Marinilabiliales bacterium]
MSKVTLFSGSIAIGLAAIMWGFDGVVLTPRLFNLDVLFVVMVLHLLPFLLMNLFLYKEYQQLNGFSKRDVLILTAVVLTGGALGTTAIVKALFLVNFQQLSIVVLLQKLQPIFALSLAALLVKERMSRSFLIWAILAIGAGYTLAFGWNLPKTSDNNSQVFAALFALLSAFCFGSSTIFSKMLLAKYHFKTITFFRYGFTSVLMIVWVIATGHFGQWTHTTPTNWMFFILIGLTTGSGAIFLYYYGLMKVKASVSVMLELLFPISAILFDYLINGTQLLLIQWISAFVMIGAIIQLNRRK